MSTTIEPMLLTSRQAAQVLNIGERSLWRLRATGAIAFVNTGKSGIRYAIDDIRAFIDANRRTEQPTKLKLTGT